MAQKSTLEKIQIYLAALLATVLTVRILSVAVSCGKQNCLFESESYQLFKEITLPFHSTLSESLYYAMNSKTEGYKCGTCGCLDDKIKVETIASPPTVLTFLLNR